MLMDFTLCDFFVYVRNSTCQYVVCVCVDNFRLLVVFGLRKFGIRVISDCNKEQRTNESKKRRKKQIVEHFPLFFLVLWWSWTDSYQQNKIDSNVYLPNLVKFRIFFVFSRMFYKVPHFECYKAWLRNIFFHRILFSTGTLTFRPSKETEKQIGTLQSRNNKLDSKS